MKVTDNVFALDSTRGSYVYVIAGQDVMLIDSGRPDQRRRIIKELLAMGIKLGDIKHILLTHHDIDHAGGAGFLQRATNSQVWTSEQDSPYVSGELHRPGIKRMIEAVFRPKTPENLHVYGQDKIGEVVVITTPGHTPGHVCLLYKDALFVGDLLHVSRGQLEPYPAFWNWDTPALMESIKRIAPLPFKWICPAHGKPVEKDALNSILS